MTTCYKCGSNNIATEVRDDIDSTTYTRRHPVTLRSIRYDVCRDCGEAYLLIPRMEELCALLRADGYAVTDVTWTGEEWIATPV